MFLKKTLQYVLISAIILVAILLFFYPPKNSSLNIFQGENEAGVKDSNMCQTDEDISEKEALSDSAGQSDESQNKVEYPIHENISVTLFWVGEKASDDNKNISNKSSAWDDEWRDHYGGVDSPEKRNGYFPAKFTPKENPFYFALPYNDFDKKGERKKDAVRIIPWAKDKKPGDTDSYCKNRWIKIMKNDKTAYAQWEDVGPFKEDDSDYVFGGAEPQSRTNKHAGLDVSPAVHDYLGISEKDTINWQFVEFSDVPDGPWKKIVTKSNICWK